MSSNGKNGIGEDDLKGLGEAFGSSPKVSDVKLLFRAGEHAATSIGFRDMIRGIHSTHLVKFWLDFREGNNAIGDVGVRELGQVFQENKKITDLKLWFR